MERQMNWEEIYLKNGLLVNQYLFFITKLISFAINQTIAGLNPEEFLSNKPEARVTQIQTLADIAKDVEADEVYRSIMKNSLTPNVI